MAGCAPVLVIVGAARDGMDAELRGTGAELVENADWECGLGGSIHAGVRHLLRMTEPREALVLLACDQPLVDEKIITHLIAKWLESGRPIVASRYAETLGIPALFARSCFDELLELPVESGAKSLLFSRPDDVAELVFAGGAIDLDTLEDVARWGGEIS